MNKRNRLVLLVAIFSSFVAFIDGSIVTVALPAIVRDFGGGLRLQEWVVDAYLVALGALILVAGSLSDTLGRVRVLRIGLIGFGVTSVLCAIAPTAEFLVAFRTLQGATAALLVPSSLALITSTFQGEARGKAIGQWTGWTGVAFIVGPLLGGALVDSIGWRWIFGINVFPIVVTTLLLTRLDKVPHTGPRHRIDLVGALLAAVGLGGPVYGLIEQEEYGWGSPVVILPLVIGILGLAAFIWWEGRVADPMMPLALFRSRNFWVGNVATAAIYGALSLGLLVITLFLQQVVGFSATAAGAATVPTTVMVLFFSSLFGSLAGRHGSRWFMAVGPVVSAAGFFLMLTVAEPANFWLQILPGIVLFGFGLSITVAPLTSAVLGAVSSRQSGIASAVNNAVSRVAGLMTVAILGLIVGGTLDYAGFHRVVVMTGALLVLGGLVSAWGIRNPAREIGERLSS